MDVVLGACISRLVQVLHLPPVLLVASVGSVMSLAKTHVKVMNLPRQKERKQSMAELLRSLGFRRVTFLVGTDAQDLAKQGARAQKTSKSFWRVTYDVDGERPSFHSEATGWRPMAPPTFSHSMRAPSPTKTC